MGVLATSKADQLILWVFLAWTIILDSWIIFHCLIPSTAAVILFFFFFFNIYLAVPGLSYSMQGF